MALTLFPLLPTQLVCPVFYGHVTSPARIILSQVSVIQRLVLFVSCRWFPCPATGNAERVRVLPPRQKVHLVDFLLQLPVLSKEEARKCDCLWVELCASGWREKPVEVEEEFKYQSAQQIPTSKYGIRGFVDTGSTQ